MALWTVCFDATISVSVEANTETCAVKAAEAAASEIENRGLCLGEGIDCSIGKVLVIRNEQTGVEILK